MSEIKKFLTNRKDNSELINNPTYGMLFNKKGFKTPPVYSFEHNDMNIDAVFETAFEEDTKGFVSHRLNLIHDNKPIGYLKIYYLQEEVFDKMNPDILHFMDNLSSSNCLGLSTHPKVIDTSNGSNNFWINKNKEEKQKTLERSALAFGDNLYQKIKKNEKNLSQNELYEKILEVANSEHTKHKERFNNYKKDHIEKPLIEFSQIKSANMKMNQDNWGEEIKEYCKERNIDIEKFGDVEHCDINYQRQGLAQKMYTLMADWLAANNLKLYRGGTNHMSTPLWEETMKSNPDINIIEQEEKTYIDHTHKDISYLNIPKEKIERKLKRR